MPTGLDATSVLTSEVDLAWNASTDNRAVTGYTVYRDGLKLGTSTSTNYADRSVAAATSYRYSVDAFDAAGNHSSQSPPLSITTPAAAPDSVKPDIPQNVRPTATYAHGVSLAWDASSDNVATTGYTVYRDGVSVGVTEATAFSDTTVAPSTDYVYTVDAFDAAGNHSDRSADLAARTADAPATPIQHVVIIDQENHSFDNVLGLICAQITSGVIQGHAPCDGATSGKLASGSTIPLSRATDIVPVENHSISGQQTAINGGRMDGFSLLNSCTSSTNYSCYSQFDASTIPNVAALAERYVISDRTFEFRATPSWAGHMILASATQDGFQGENPKQSTFTTQTGPGWGCDSFKDGLWWNGAQYVLEPSCVPDSNGNGPYRPSPVPYVPTIFDRFDDAGLSWKIYGGAGTATGSGWGWTICPTFYECIGSSQRGNLVNSANIVTDAQAGTLPNLSIVTPTDQNSQHNKDSMAVGDNWIGKVVSAIQGGPDWASTAVFITWDDCGCFYDHVPPPAPGLGIRVPMVIVSPYALAGGTDSNTATFLSLMSFSEHTFGLTPLNSEDEGAYDYAGSFDYTQTPLLSATRTVRTRISKQERAYIAAHPSREGDVT